MFILVTYLNQIHVTSGMWLGLAPSMSMRWLLQIQIEVVVKILNFLGVHMHILFIVKVVCLMLILLSCIPPKKICS